MSFDKNTLCEMVGDVLFNTMPLSLFSIVLFEHIIPSDDEPFM